MVKAILGDRTTYVGASSVAAACGYSVYETRFERWARMTGRMPEQPHKRIFDRGHDMETVMVRMLKKDFGLKVTDRQAEFIDSEASWLKCHVDGVIPEWQPIPGRTYPDPGVFHGPGTLELKAPGSRKAAEFMEAGLSTDYIFQAAAQQRCSGFNWTRYAFLDYDNWRLVCFDVARDGQFIDGMMRNLCDFWDCVVTDTEPSEVIQSMAVPVVDGACRTMTDYEEEADLLAQAFIEAKRAEAAYDSAKKIMAGYLADIGKAEWPGLLKLVFTPRAGREYVRSDQLLDWTSDLTAKVRAGDLEAAQKMARVFRPGNFKAVGSPSRPMVPYLQGDTKVQYKQAMAEFEEVNDDD